MLNSNNIIDNFINRATWETNENANIPFSIMSLNNDLAEAAHKQYWLTQVYDKEIRNAYEDGFFHIHNLGHLSTYCVGWNLEDILKMGFKGQPGRQVSRPAKHFRTALNHVNNFLFTLQGESAGAQALSNFDTYLAPFIAMDGLNQKEVDQAVQEFIFNINVSTRVGGQPPFTNVTLDQVVPKFMKDDNAIIGGELSDHVYGDFQDEMEMLNGAWWRQRIRGDGNGSPQPFPIETLNVTRDFNWEDETLFKAVALRGTPYFSNYINSDMNPEDVRSMCCRLRIDNSVLRKRGGGFFGSSPLTGSIGVVTLNMPLMAYKAKDEDEFFDYIDYYMEQAKRSLELKRKKLEFWTQVTKLYPYSSIYLDSVFKRFKAYWANHFSTIGILGMNEACSNLIGEDIRSQSGHTLAIKVLDHMRNKSLEFQEETNNMYNIEATPAESTAYKLAMKDSARYKDIITSGTVKRPYYTNSTQLPVGTDKSLGYVLKHQDPLQTRYTGGTVLHIWNGEVTPEWDSVAKLVKRIATNFEINYYTYSPTTSVCETHGLMAGEQPVCPKCGKKNVVWQRVTGYFSPVSQWNIGKQQEFTERHHFSVSDKSF